MAQIQTTKVRHYDVTQALANHSIEGFNPDDEDKRNLTAYVLGGVTVGDLLHSAREFALKAKTTPRALLN